MILGCRRWHQTLGVMLCRCCFACAVTRVTLAAIARADDWPGFMGPGRSGISGEKRLSRSWPAAGPRIVWSVDLGKGFGGAAVRDGRVYVLDRPDDRQDVLRCLDLQTGRELWRFAYDAPGTLPYPGSRNVPTVDQQAVYTVGPFGDLHRISTATGKALWSHHLVREFKDPDIDREEPPTGRADKLARAQVPEWGFVQSPILYKDLVLVAPQTQKVGLVAYESATGMLRWQSAAVGRSWFCYASPYLTTLGGVEQIIALGHLTDPDKDPAKAPPAVVSAIEPETGRILWTTRTPRPHKIPIPSPVNIGDDRLLLTGGLGFGAAILQVRKDGEDWSHAWTTSRNCAASIHTPILHEGHIYTESGRGQGAITEGMVCLDASLAVKWQTGPKQSFQSGGFIIADGLLFIMNGRTGELLMAEAKPAVFKELGRARVLGGEGGTIWAPLALSDGRLLVRDLRQMRCVDVRNP